MQDFSDILKRLQSRLGETLPGDEAHRMMMQHRKPLSKLSDQLEQARQSAVLLLMYPKHQALHTVFIKRPSYDGVHSGQIALPGGKVEESDRDIIHTALREANEELGIISSEVEVLGKLSPLYIPPSNFLVHPILGFSKSIPLFIPDPIEVENFMELPIGEFTNPENLKDTNIRVGKSEQMKVKAYALGGEIIWGATSMIMAEFASLLKELNEPL